MSSFLLVSYADEQMSISQQKLIDSFRMQAQPFGTKRINLIGPHNYSPYSLRNPYQVNGGSFYADNRKILCQARGSGYWLWKPYIIKKALDAVHHDDFVMYADAGIEIRGDISQLLDLKEQILLFNNEWPHVDWCKMDVLKSMLPEWSNPGQQQVQASVILIRKNDFTYEFVKEWLLWCQIPGFIDDSPSRLPNIESFQEHRHDQAILTNLAIKNGINTHWWPAHYNTGNKFKYPNDNYEAMFYHHRFRNHEWPQ